MMESAPIRAAALWQGALLREAWEGRASAVTEFSTTASAFVPMMNLATPLRPLCLAS